MFAKLPLSFEPNYGQTDGSVQYIAHSPTATVFVSGADAVLQTNRFHKDAHGLAQFTGSNAVRMHLLGAAEGATATPGQPLGGTVTYIKGRDKASWQTGLPTYGAVTATGVYPGIDLKYYGREGQLEYDFIVAPDADPAAVRLQFAGTVATLGKGGNLDLPTANATLHFDKPVAYQTLDGRRVPVEASFQVAANHEVTFKLGAYDHSRELTIDPTLIYLGTLGAGTYPNYNDTTAITVDGTGALYLTGTTTDAAFPVSSGAFQTVCGPTAGNSGQLEFAGGYCNGTGGGETAAYVTKLSPDGTQIVYSTYLSGKSGTERGGSITVDAAGVAYLLGATSSNDFPITADAFQSMCQPYGYPTQTPQCDNYYDGGGSEYTINGPVFFFAKLNATGTALTYASFLGGSPSAYPLGTALDSSGNWYLFGQTSIFAPSAMGNSSNPGVQFPGITSSGYQTVSTDMPAGGSGPANNDIAFVLSKFSNDGHTLLYGTFFSDPVYNVPLYPQSFAVGANGYAFLGGYTQSTNMPVTPGAIKPACLSPGTNYAGAYCNTFDGFVAAIDTTKAGAASLAFSTRLGGTATGQGSNIPDQEVLGLAADSNNNLYATGYTLESTFPIPSNGYQAACPLGANPTAAFCSAAYAIKLNSTGTAVLAGTFLGGTSPRPAGTVGYNIKLDSKNQVYVYGQSNDGGGDFPTVNPLQGYKAGSQLIISTLSADMTQLLFSTRFGNPSYPDHGVSVAGGMALDPSGNIYFTGTTTDGTFAGTAGTYNTSTTSGGGGRHTFFGKISPVLALNTATLTLTPATVSAGGQLTYTAVIAGTTVTTPTPTGTVTFSLTNTTPATVAGTAMLDATGTATLTTAAPAAGTYTVVASYTGDTVYDVSTSAPATLTVNTVVASAVALTATPTSAKTGTSVSFTASVTGSGGTPTGTVTFLDGTNAIGSAPLTNGAATIATSTLAAGGHSITASYGGDSTFAGGTSAPQVVTITANTVNLALAVTSPLIPVGGAETLNATLSGATGTTAPTGGIVFFDGKTAIGTVPLAGSGASLTPTLAAGTHSFTAMYSGDGLYAAVTSAAQTVTVQAPAATTTTLTSSSASVAGGVSVTFTAAVSSAVMTAAPTGTVTFFDGTTSLGQGTVANGSATYATSALTVGSHSITATYSGDALFLTSTAAALTQTVVAPSIALSASPATITVTRGGSGTTTITVTPTGAYSGTISFSCGKLPTDALCTFAPTTLAFAASTTAQTATLTFATTGGTAAMLGEQPQFSRAARVLTASFFFPLTLLGLLRRRRAVGQLGNQLGNRLGMLVLFLLASFAIAGLSGCGGGQSNATPTGSYTVTVNATVSGAVAATLPVSVTVQ